jgi:hypothetical protein
MNQVSWMAMFCGFLLFVPVDHVRSQISLSQYIENSHSTDKLESQATHPNHPWWVNLGAGPAFVGTAVAMSAGMVYSYQFDQSLISGRILGITNYNPTVQEIDRSNTLYKMADYGILYGPLWRTEYGYLSIGTGIGLVRAAYETSTDNPSKSSISIPIEAQWFWRFTPYAGIGVYTYATLNYEKPFYGVLVCAQLGAW